MVQIGSFLHSLANALHLQLGQLWLARMLIGYGQKPCATILLQELGFSKLIGCILTFWCLLKSTLVSHSIRQVPLRLNHSWHQLWFGLLKADVLKLPLRCRNISILINYHSVWWLGIIDFGLCLTVEWWDLHSFVWIAEYDYIWVLCWFLCIRPMGCY